MGIFDKIFGTDLQLEKQPDVKFGRYTDAYKSNAQYDAWERSIEAFEDKKYLDAYDQFFKYLKDENVANVHHEESNGVISFEIFQGSKKLTGTADLNKITVMSKVAHTKNPNIGFMRRLMEKNFFLKFSRFALDDDNNLVIIFNSDSIVASPYKLYYAIKEVATHADKQDDLLLDEFDSLTPVDVGHVNDLPIAEKEVKYHFIQNKIKDTLNTVDTTTLDLNSYPGALAYLYMDLNYSLDYLTKPEGFVMETMERIHRSYFEKDDKSVAQKNITIKKDLKEMLGRSKEDYFKELYLINSTFGVTSPVDHDRVASFIDGELGHMDWYFEQGHKEIALAIPGYVVGYCFFNFGLPKPIHAFFHLYYQIVESKYFKDLGFTLNYYDEMTKTFDKRVIIKSIRYIVSENENRFPKLNPDTRSLNFDNLVSFAKSYILMVRNLNMMRKD